MPLLRSGIVAGIAAGLVVACSSEGAVSGSRQGTEGAWEDGIPDDEPAVVTIENLSYDPPRILGLVSEDHPSAQTEEAAIRRSGIKRVPPDRMEELLEVLEDEGFLDSSAPLAEFKPVDAKVVLRRLTVTIGDERRAFTLPRRPAPELAERFNRQAHAVQALFNEIVDFRQDTTIRDPLYFYEVEQRLYETNKRKRAIGSSP